MNCLTHTFESNLNEHIAASDRTRRIALIMSDALVEIVRCQATFEGQIAMRAIAEQALAKAAVASRQEIEIDLSLPPAQSSAGNGNAASPGSQLRVR